MSKLNSIVLVYTIDYKWYMAFNFYCLENIHCWGFLFGGQVFGSLQPSLFYYLVSFWLADWIVSLIASLAVVLSWMGMV